MCVLWKSVEVLTPHLILWKNVELQTDNSCAFMPWKRENRCVYIECDTLHTKVFIETLHGHFRRIVVFAEMAQHNVFDAWMVNLCNEPRRLGIAQMAERT